MDSARKLLGHLLFAIYLVLVLCLCGLLPPASGAGPWSSLLYGHLDDPNAAALGRAVGLGVVALSLFLRPRLVPLGAVGRGLFLGLVGLLILVLPAILPAWLNASGGLTRLVIAGLCLALLLPFGRQPKLDPVQGDQGASQAEDDQPAGSPIPLLLAGEVLAGAGLALALGAVWVRLGLFGYHGADEAHLRAAVLLGLMAIGSLAFGPSLARFARGTAAVAPALAATGALVGLWLLAPLQSRGPLETLLRSFGDLDLTAIGAVQGTALLAARTLVVSGFALGLLVAVARERRLENTALLAGAGLGAAAWPMLVRGLEACPEPLGSGMALVGLALCALGALPRALGGLLRGPGPARLTSAALVAVVAAGFLVPREAIRPLSPWLRFEAVADLAIDTPLGFLTVENTPLGAPILTLDRVAMTPAPEQVPGDSARLVAALDLAAANWQPGDPNLEVLLAGQLTLDRLEAFETWRKGSPIDAALTWTTPWDAWQDRLRPLLEGSWTLPDPLPFDEAEQRIGSGHFDLVVVPLCFGTQVTALEALDPPRAAAPPAARPQDDQPAVVWLPAGAPLVGADLGELLLPGGADLDHLGLGMVSRLTGPSLLPAGDPTSNTWVLGRLGVAPEMRPILDRAALFTRLGAASGGAFVPALAQLFLLQERSSPWADPDLRFELDQAQLEALAAATEAPLDGIQELAWAHLARILIAKRSLSGESLAVLPGLLEKVDSFPPIEHALARAYFELLMPAEGAELLLPLYEAGWRAPAPLLDLAWALGQGGDWARAAEIYGVVLEELPGFHYAERRLAMAELRAGLPDGAERARELLDEDPGDTELAEYLKVGPPPKVAEDFDPNPLSSLGDGHEDH